MRSIYTARLVNGVWGDPGICIDLKFERHAVLFDIGDVAALATRMLLRVSDVFVSHTHMDHFAGFDQLLRVCLGRDTGVRLYGPEGFIDRVEHKLAAYTWNLVQNYATDFVVEVHEVGADGRVPRGAIRESRAVPSRAHGRPLRGGRCSARRRAVPRAGTGARASRYRVVGASMLALWRRAYLARMRAKNPPM